jgi:hypothetical protein
MEASPLPHPYRIMYVTLPHIYHLMDSDSDFTFDPNSEEKEQKRLNC